MIALCCAAPAAALAEWEPARAINQVPSGSAASMWGNAFDVGVGANGLATAIFFQEDSDSPYFARRAADASAWSAPVQAAGLPDATQQPERVELDAAADGSATATWSSTVAGQAARWDASASGPGAAAAVFGPGARPQVAVDDAGNAYAVAAAPPEAIHFSRYDAGTGAWSAPVPVADGTNPRIAANGRGDLAITYQRTLVPEDTVGPSVGRNDGAVFVRRAPAGAGFSDEERLDEAGGFVERHDVAVAEDGAITAVFTDDKDETPVMTRAYARRWEPGATLAPAELLSSPREAGRPAVDPRVVVDSAGRVTAAWTEMEGSPLFYRLYSAERVDSRGFGFPQRVSPASEHVSDDGSSEPPGEVSPENERSVQGDNWDLAVDADGTATIVYNDAPDGIFGTQGRDTKAVRRATGGRWAEPVSLRKPEWKDSAGGTRPRVAAVRAGQVDVLFAQIDDTGRTMLVATRFEGPPPPSGEHQTMVTSFDGTDILVQWCPAAGLDPGEDAPTVIAGSGWGFPGRRCPGANSPEEELETTFGNTSVEKLTSAGYNVLTFDARGFWRSGGEVQVNSPAYEGRDMQALIDFAAAQPEALLDGPDDPRLGMAGGSYGGGIQLVTAALDQRVDAIAPAIAWNSLVTSLFPRETVKASWAAILVGAGVPTTTLPGVLSPAGIEAGNMAPEIYEATAQGAAAGTIDAQKRAWFAARGPDFLLDRIEAPTLLIQGTVDTLFTLDEAHRNFEALEAAGTEVKMVWFCGGHGACERHGADQAHVDERVLAWFDRHLRGREVSTGPVFEWVDEDGSWHESASYPPAHNDVLEGTGKATLALAPGEMPGSGGVIFATPYTYGSDHPAAIEVPIEVPPPSTPVIGPPQLRAIYTATGTSTYGTGVEGAAQNRTYVYAQIVDNSRQRVVGNQATPIPITLDGKEHELALPLERIASSSLRAGYSLQIVPQTSVYDGQRAAGQVTFRSIDIKLPINGPGDVVPPVGGATAGGGGATAGGGGATVAPPGSTAGRSRVWKCEGVAATITGTPRSEVISGTPGRDVIVARGGSDTIRARGGRDVICAGSGSDRVFAGAGNDHAFGNAGRDVVRGDNGSDRLLGQRGHDRLRGGLGNDRLLGGFGNDRLLGGAGNDVLRGERDRDILTGGAGDDRLSGAKGSDRLSGGAGNDVLRGERGRDTLIGGAGSDGLFGGAGNDVLRGHRRSDLLRGGSGTDRILTAG